MGIVRWARAGFDLPWSIGWAAWRFATQRADYYEFLARSLQQSRSSRTLLDIFRQDYQRHGRHSPRGLLSQWWAARYLATGGDLSQTWRLTLPASDLACLGVAQRVGELALVEALQALAQQTRAMRLCASDFWQTCAAGLVAMIVAFVCVVIMPLFTAPRLVASFSMVPEHLYGPSTQALLAWALWVQQGWWLGGLVLLVAIAGLAWSFGSLTGRLRDGLDRIMPWSLYRDIQAMRFLVACATHLNALQRQGVSLRTVISVQQTHANSWLNSHLSRMTTRLDFGLDALDALDTGLLCMPVWWQLVDVVRTHGLTEGLRMASYRLCEDMARRIRRRGWALRWLLLAMSLGIVFTVGAWHARVIEELRQSLAFFYAQ